VTARSARPSRVRRGLLGGRSLQPRYVIRAQKDRLGHVLISKLDAHSDDARDVRVGGVTVHDLGIDPDPSLHRAHFSHTSACSSSTVLRRAASSFLIARSFLPIWMTIAHATPKAMQASVVQSSMNPDVAGQGATQHSGCAERSSANGGRPAMGAGRGLVDRTARASSAAAGPPLRCELVDRAGSLPCDDEVGGGDRVVLLRDLLCVPLLV
jgi:hypothetical protein